MGFSLNVQDIQAVEFRNATKRLSALIVKRMVKFWLQSDLLFHFLGYGKIYNKDLNFVHSFTEKIIRERKISYINKTNQLLTNNEKEDVNFLSKKRRAFLDILVELSIKNPDLLTDADIREEVDTFLFEGHDTTSAAIGFALYLLGLHPEIEERAYQEQLNIFGDSERAANNQDLHEMHYLEMVIKETLRLFPSVPYISRKTDQEIDLPGGYRIPAGVILPIFSCFLHTNPELYPNPNVFDPERFTYENSKNRRPYSYIPFSAGPRNCIGQKFAMMELKVVLSTAIRFLKFESLTKREDMSLLPFLILKTDPPIQMKVTPRSTAT